MSGEVCTDKINEIIEKVKNHLIESTNITLKVWVESLPYAKELIIGE
jgi:hypothetical protein